MNNSKTQKRNRTRHSFLLTFFQQDEDFYEEKQVNGFWLVKQWNAGNNNWEVAIYERASFKKKQHFLDFDKQVKHLGEIE